jgi:hypothetical protein
MMIYMASLNNHNKCWCSWCESKRAGCYMPVAVAIIYVLLILVALVIVINE